MSNGHEDMSSLNPYAPPTASVDARESERAPALWNPNSAGLWSLLFTPVFGSVLLLKNWREIGADDKVRSARIWLVVSIVIMVPALVVGLIGFVYLMVGYFASQKPQATFVKERWGDDYPRKPWGAPLLIAFGCWLAVAVALVLVVTGLAAR
ncbi:MAG TPA: hypothetical protein VHP37_17520 [Burkholderiales bacterium]|nr:hypothetical protein [Burkholderiales bacterium]